MKIIFTSLLLISYSNIRAYAEEIGISVGPKNELILSHSSCSKLQKEALALCTWKKSTDQNFVIPDMSNFTCKKNKIIINECLPDFVKRYQKKRLINNGPNCWGTAMGLHKLFPTPRFMWPEEMQYWLESSVCRKLNPTEAKLPGDIINVYSPEKLDDHERRSRDFGTEFWEAAYPNRFTTPIQFQGSDYSGFHRLLHSETYISNELAFGKDSPSFSDRFNIHALKEMYGRPRDDEKDCQENQVMSPHMREYQKLPKDIKGSKCSYFSQAYRCGNFEETFKATFKKYGSAMNNVLMLEQFQEKLFMLLTNPASTPSNNDIARALELSDSMIEKSLVQIKNPKLSIEQKNLAVLEYFTAAGMKQTLEQLGLMKLRNY